MQTATSKLTQKYQATIPRAVRQALHLQAGESIAFDIEDGEIRLRKTHTLDLKWASALEATLSEWAGKADEEAYRDL